MGDNVYRLEDRPSDAQLVERALAGTLSAKEQLFRRYVGLCSNIAFRLTGHDGEVEDIVQDSFISAFENLGRLQEPAAFRGWLTSIVTRTAIANIRKRKLLRRLGLLRHEPVKLESLVSTQAPPEVAIELRAVYAVIDRLPAVERVCLLLRRFDQLSLEQIAEQTGCSLATVKRRIARADQFLERALSSGDAS